MSYWQTKTEYPDPSMTVREALERWQKFAAIGKKPSTLKYHRELLKSMIDQWPDLETRTGDATESDCLTFVGRIDHFSIPRYNSQIFLLRRLIPAAAAFKQKKVPKYDQHLPTEEEFNRLLSALDVAHRGHAGLVVRFLAYTGLRINEARQLTWRSIAKDQINVPGSVTKNGSPRSIPFFDGIQTVLESLRLISKGDRVLPQASCMKALRYACELAGVPRTGHHSFRHLFATRCIESGVDIPTIAKWMGHRDGGLVLLRTYCHLLDEHSMEMAKRVKIGVRPTGGRLASPINVISLPRSKPDQDSRERRVS